MRIRKATINDADILLKWKNDPVMRKFSIVSHEKIKKADHLVWLKKHLDEIHIIEVGDVPVGDIRIEEKEIAIKIDKQYRSKGIGKKALREMVSDGDTAKIVDGNVASMRLFIGCGFNIISHKIKNNRGYYILRYDN